MLAKLSGPVIPGIWLVTYGDEDNCGTVQYKWHCCRVSELTMQRAMRPWLHPKVFFDMTNLGKRYVQCLSVLHSFTNRVSLCLFHEFWRSYEHNINTVSQINFIVHAFTSNSTQYHDVKTNLLAWPILIILTDRQRNTFWDFNESY
jgi:hypothetical protein